MQLINLPPELKRLKALLEDRNNKLTLTFAKDEVKQMSVGDIANISVQECMRLWKVSLCFMQCRTRFCTSCLSKRPQDALQAIRPMDHKTPSQAFSPFWTIHARHGGLCACLSCQQSISRISIILIMQAEMACDPS